MVKALTFTGWFLGLATISVLPFDIALANESNASTEVAESTAEMEYFLRICWRVFYWTAFGFSFLLVPFVMHYEMSGEFEHSMKLRYAAWKVAVTYTRYAIIGAIFLVFLWFQGTFSESNGLTVRGFAMAAGSAFGLLQIIVFLGYGLVNIPRRLKLMNTFER